MEITGDYGRGVNAAFEQVDRLAADLVTSSGAFTVNKDNVLAAAKIFHTQADALHDKLKAAVRDLRVVPPGADDVSIRIAPAWNDLLLDAPYSYRNRINQYIEGLHNLARQCGDSARAYGYTDEQIAAVFGGQSA